MPQRKSGIKALRVNKRRRMRNLDIKTELKKTIKNYQGLVAQNKIAEAKEALRIVFKKLDKAVKCHVLYKNTAAHRKSRFSKLLLKKS
ncbi:MAG: 30S ribosomal protein S20 [Candidatus Omnitrophota bacterium]